MNITWILDFVFCLGDSLNWQKFKPNYLDNLTQCIVFYFVSKNVSFFYFVKGRSHDPGIPSLTGPYDELVQRSNAQNWQPLCIYGDEAYHLRTYLQTSYKHNNLYQEEILFNTAMSKVRISVEWIFGEITNYFAFLNFKKNLELGLSEVAAMYQRSALLREAMTCLYGSTTSTYFGLEPPQLEDYFQWQFCLNNLISATILRNWFEYAMIHGWVLQSFSFQFSLFSLENKITVYFYTIINVKKGFLCYPFFCDYSELLVG